MKLVIKGYEVEVKDTTKATKTLEVNMYPVLIWNK